MHLKTVSLEVLCLCYISNLAVISRNYFYFLLLNKNCTLPFVYSFRKIPHVKGIVGFLGKDYGSIEKLHGE